MNNNDIDQLMRKTKSYWHVDGLVELALGSLFLLLGVYFLVQASLPEESLLAQLMGVFLMVLVIGGVLLTNRFVRELKERITYPRTGYVTYHQKKGSRLLAAVFGAGVAVIVVILYVTAPASLAWMPVITGLIIGAVVLVIGYRVNLIRFYALAAFSFLLGIGLSLAGIGDILGLAIYYMAMGVGVLLSGGLTLRNYLRSTQPPVDEET